MNPTDKTRANHVTLRGRRLPGTAPITVQGFSYRGVVHLSIDGARPIALDPDTARQLADALVDHSETAESGGDR